MTEAAAATPAPACLRRRLGVAVQASPCTTVGILSLILMGASLALGLDPDDGGLGALVFRAWVLPLRPFAWVATRIDPVTGRWPDAADAAATVAAGLLPYLAADWVWRRVRARTRPPS